MPGCKRQECVKPQQNSCFKCSIVSVIVLVLNTNQSVSFQLESLIIKWPSRESGQSDCQHSFHPSLQSERKRGNEKKQTTWTNERTVTEAEFVHSVFLKEMLAQQENV